MGATSPGRWQFWQFFCKMGRTSLLKVTLAPGSLGAGAETATTAVNNVARPMRFKQHLRLVNPSRSTGFGSGSDAILFSSLRTNEDTLLKENNSYVENDALCVVSNRGRPSGGLLVWTDHDRSRGRHQWKSFRDPHLYSGTGQAGRAAQPLPRSHA